jgi:hypothetical protein
MQVEVTLANHDGRLLPGAYVQVALPLLASAALTAPTGALLFRAEGAMVAVVDAKGRVSLRRVSVGRNYGETFEVQGGISADDRLILNPADGIADGQTVVVVAPAARAASGAASDATAGKGRS